MQKATIFLLFLLLLTGCRQSAQPTPALSVPDPIITLTTEPNPPQAGQGTLLITVTSGDGTPLDVQKINVRGDMTHAGMRPEFAESSSGNGVFSLPFNWSMGGDWILTVTVTLPDNSQFEREFRVSVGS